ncbi:YfdX family protein [Flavitalea sp.]|nr:YfdX family protein [Flavitalea sp.]
MKNILAMVALIIYIGYLISCNENRSPTINSPASGRDTNTGIAKPPEANLSPQKVQDRINKEIHEALAASNDSIKGEAVMVIAETHNAIRQLLDSNYTAAIKAIERALGKAEAITIVNPHMGFVPVGAGVIVRDLMTDMETLKEAKDDIEDLTDKGYLQTVRQLVDVMVSEISITTSNLPLGTYPAALKTAVELTRENRAADAALLLNAALNTIVVIDRSIPLPLVRAELMLATADSLIAATNNIKEEEINSLLDNADYQIRFAEELGYGKRDAEFKEFRDDIKELKKEVKDKGSDRQNMISRLRMKLNAFKKRISPETKK